MMGMRWHEDGVGMRMGWARDGVVVVGMRMGWARDFIDRVCTRRGGGGLNEIIT